MTYDVDLPCFTAALDHGADRVRIDTGDGAHQQCSRVPEGLGSGPYRAEELRHGLGNAATGGIWRVRGTAGSAVLKIVLPPSPERSGRAWPTSDEPTHWNAWRREVLAYGTGFAAAAYAEAGIAVPGLLGADARVGGGVELWLQDVSGPAGFAWEVSRIARFAYELGAGQARWAGRVPDTRWLSRRWLAQYLREEPSRSVRVRTADWDDPRVTAWPRDARRHLARLWADRDRVLAAAEAGPRTLCHLDVWPSNLIDREGTSVLVDWSFTGEGALGEDVANLIVDSCADGLMDAALLPEIAETAVDGYLRGLRDAGWTGSPDQVRRAIAACGAAKYSWFGPTVLRRALLDDSGTSSYGQDTSAAAAVQRLAGVVTLIARWGDQATA